MPATKKSVCIIAFKPVRTTIHVLRQIDYLARDFALTVIGHGEPDPGWPPLQWHGIPAQTRLEKITKLFWFLLGKLFPTLYDVWFWQTRRHQLAYQYALASGADAFHANDWPSLPIAVEAARRVGGRVVFHMHEYAELERMDSFVWWLLVSPAIRYLIRKYAGQSDVPIDASLTVCDPIAARYHRELGLDPIVVYNAPKPASSPERSEPQDDRLVRMIHHGYAKRHRGLHKLVEAVAAADKRFVLDFMLVEDDQGYIDELKRLADRIAFGRVRFRDPVPPGEIVSCVSEYDVGLCVISPSTYNNYMMLPNKLFEYTQAGLALVVGPSPAMVDLVRQHGMGVVTRSFEPADIAAALDELTWSRLRELRQAARQAAAVLNADVEMGKVVAVYRQLLDVRP